MKVSANGKDNPWITGSISVIIGICMVLIMAVSAVEIAAYADYGFYKKEYEKYDVNNPSGILGIETDELIRVTKEMMSYLRGGREDLVIYANIDGVEKEMFNDREKYHMADVRELFIGGLWVRVIAAMIVVLGLTALSLLYGFKKVLKSVCKWVSRVLYGVWAFIAVVAIAAAVNFTAMFTVFHQIFFSNDMWIFDERISRLINMLPEGFFVDMAIRIGVIYIMLNVIILVLAFWVKRGKIFSLREKNINGGTYEHG